MRMERPANIPKLENYEPSRFMLPTSHYDEKKADRAVQFIEMLKHTKGKWAEKPFWLFPWQEQVIRDIFGIVDENGKRQFRTAFVEIGKKNGKQGRRRRKNRPGQLRLSTVCRIFFHRWKKPC